MKQSILFFFISLFSIQSFANELNLNEVVFDDVNFSMLIKDVPKKYYYCTFYYCKKDNTTIYFENDKMSSILNKVDYRQKVNCKSNLDNTNGYLLNKYKKNLTSLNYNNNTIVYNIKTSSGIINLNIKCEYNGYYENLTRITTHLTFTDKPSLILKNMFD